MQKTKVIAVSEAGRLTLLHLIYFYFYYRLQSGPCGLKASTNTELFDMNLWERFKDESLFFALLWGYEPSPVLFQLAWWVHPLSNYFLQRWRRGILLRARVPSVDTGRETKGGGESPCLWQSKLTGCSKNLSISRRTVGPFLFLSSAKWKSCAVKWTERSHGGHLHVV